MHSTSSTYCEKTTKKENTHTHTYNAMQQAQTISWLEPTKHGLRLGNGNAALKIKQNEKWNNLWLGMGSSSRINQLMLLSCNDIRGEEDEYMHIHIHIRTYTYIKKKNGNPHQSSVIVFFTKLGENEMAFQPHL